MHEKGGRPGAGESGGNFIRDMPGFTHAENDYPSATRQHVAGCRHKRLIHLRNQALNGLGFDLENGLGQRNQAGRINASLLKGHQDSGQSGSGR